MATANQSQDQSTVVLSLSWAPLDADVRLLALAEAAYQRASRHDAAHRHEDLDDLLAIEQELWARLADPVSHQAL
jgi:hypothetical protein